MEYYFNKTEFCSECHKLRYMGSTIFYDAAMCICKHPENIPSYINETKFESYLTENYHLTVMGAPKKHI